MLDEDLINTHFEQIAGAIPGLVAVSLVDIESGMTIGSRCDHGGFDIAAASAYVSELVKQEARHVAALGLQTPVEDIMITLGDQIQMIRLLTPLTFLFVVVERATTNLAIVRSIVARHAGGLSG